MVKSTHDETLIQDNESSVGAYFKPFSEEGKNLAYIGEVNSSGKNCLPHSGPHTPGRSVANYFRANYGGYIVFKLGPGQEKEICSRLTTSLALGAPEKGQM